MRHTLTTLKAKVPQWRRFVGMLSLLSLLALTYPSFAQNEESADADRERWYQIEVIVFSRPGGDSGEEAWPRNLILSYPFDWVELRDPDNPEPGPGFGSLEAGNPDLRAEDQAVLDPSRDPYVQLPNGERRLNRHADALRRQGGYRVLFHQGWRQPLEVDAKTPALLIAGGDAYGQHFELEGSLRLALSRYLHLDTNLWLTRFEPNYGQAPGSWPQLPARPSLQSVAEPVLDIPLARRSGNAWDLGLDSESALPEFLREPYLPSRIVSMKQQRRMRSEELHYLDHPLLGLLIEITPYERPAEEQSRDSF